MQAPDFSSEITTETPLLSVIVPIYNTPAAYLTRCIDSLIRQTYTRSEILLINDGSDEATASLVDRLSTRDPRIRVCHKENGGVSSARNLGLSMMRGDILTFIDADDYLEPNAWECALAAMLETGAQMVAFGWYDHLADGDLVEHCITFEHAYATRDQRQAYLRSVTLAERILDDGSTCHFLIHPDDADERIIVSQADYLRAVVSDNIYYGAGYPWNKLWRTDALRDAQGHLPLFDEHLTIYEDKLWIIEAASRIKRAVILPDIFYHYMFLPTSLTHQDTEILDRQPIAYAAYDRILDFLQAHGDKELSHAAAGFYFDFIYEDLMRLRDKEHRKAYRTQYQETLRTFRTLCKRIEPGTLDIPRCSARMFDWMRMHYLP